MDLYNVTVHIIIEIARTIIIMAYYKIFLDMRNKVHHIWTGILAFMMAAVSYLVINNNVVNLLSTVLGMFIIASAFKGNIKSKVLLTLMCYSIMMAIDFIVFFVDLDKTDQQFYQTAISFMSVLIFYAVIMLLKFSFRKKLKSEFMGQWYILLIVSIMSIGVLFVIYKDSLMSVHGIVVLSTVMMIMNFLLYVFYSDMLDRFVYLEENSRLKQQMNFYEQQLNANLENDKKIRLVRHDMKHHIREINALATKGRLEDIKAYTKELANDIKSSETIYNTGNVTLDGILNYYYGRFEENKIHTDINVIIPENLNMGAYDFNILFGNLLDNALENAVKSKKPQVIVDVKYEGHVLSIYVANTFDGVINKTKETFLSQKGNNHGYGLENIRRICLKYNGDIKIEYNEEMFIVGVVMYM